MLKKYCIPFGVKFKYRYGNIALLTIPINDTQKFIAVNISYDQTFFVLMHVQKM